MPVMIYLNVNCIMEKMLFMLFMIIILVLLTFL